MEMIAIDLLWLRPQKVGGTEYFIRNLLDGFRQLDKQFRFVLLCSEDNAYSFEEYTKDSRINMLVAPINNSNITLRILWQWFCQNSFLKKNNIRKCFSPVYCRPLFNGGISYLNVIHDLQVYHFPKYHPLHEIIYTKITWMMNKIWSKEIIAISDFVKKDLVNVYKFDSQKITTIHNPIVIDKSICVDFCELKNKYAIEENQYYYMIGQFIPHKNIQTLIHIMAKIKKENIALPCKLLLSGISGSSSEAIKELIHKNNVDEEVIVTGFVTDAEKICLYSHCRDFLFPSIFEGFGMPLVEAMACGATVITTKCACIPEITQNLATYVEDPYDVDEWIELMKRERHIAHGFDFNAYDVKVVAEKYMDVIERVLL